MCDRGDVARAGFSVVFDGSFDGFLCIVYAFYYEKITPLYIQTEENYQRTLDADEYYVSADPARAARVLEGIQEKISGEAVFFLYNAQMAFEEDRFMDMFRYVVLGFKVGARVDEYLQVDYVARVHRLSKYATHEAHMLSGFCRFAETKQGVYYCVVTPKNHILPILAEHFRDRFMNHAWIIHDKKHGMAAVYDGYEYIIEPVPPEVNVIYTDEEEHIQDLWVAFFNTIAIKERKNKKLQRQNAALYFRENMTEFQKRLR